MLWFTHCGNDIINIFCSFLIFLSDQIIVYFNVYVELEVTSTSAKNNPHLEISINGALAVNEWLMVVN